MRINSLKFHFYSIKLGPKDSSFTSPSQVIVKLCLIIVESFQNCRAYMCYFSPTWVEYLVKVKHPAGVPQIQNFFTQIK